MTVIFLKHMYGFHQAFSVIMHYLITCLHLGCFPAICCWPRAPDEKAQDSTACCMNFIVQYLFIFLLLLNVYFITSCKAWIKRSFKMKWNLFALKREQECKHIGKSPWNTFVGTFKVSFKTCSSKDSRMKLKM